jgi:hypothetical protein
MSYLYEPTHACNAIWADVYNHIYNHTIHSPDPQAPRSVSSYCAFIVWQAPSTVYGTITGYDIMFLKSNNQFIFPKRRNELFHIIEEGNIPDGEGEVLVQVR